MNIQSSIYTFPLKRKSNRILKRTLDIVLSLIVLTAIYPVAYIIIGCCIKIKMPGKIIFTQKRNGLYGKVFTCYKFRSMLPNVEADTQQAYNEDPRITPLGHFLRVTSLDELPQFWNVLKGDMSVVVHVLICWYILSNIVISFLNTIKDLLWSRVSRDGPRYTTCAVKQRSWIKWKKE